MGCDMVVALPRATTDRHTLFGHNNNRPAAEGQSLVRVPDRDFAPGAAVRTSWLTLPQARQTHTVLACRSPGLWGYWHGVNENHVGAGVTAIRTRLACAGPVLTGTDLVRLALERAASARQAVDVLTDLVNRHGQGTFPGDASYPADPQAGDEVYDSSFLVADSQEAYVLETCGCHWALQVVGAVRAVTDLCQ